MEMYRNTTEVHSADVPIDLSTQTLINKLLAYCLVQVGNQQAKTKAHIEALRERQIIPGRLEKIRETGWKINEENLSTLPLNAPMPARSLARDASYLRPDDAH